MGLACDASVRRPLAARLPAARDGAVSAGHLPPVQREGTAQDRVGTERGEIGEPVTFCGTLQASQQVRIPFRPEDLDAAAKLAWTLEGLRSERS